MAEIIKVYRESLPNVRLIGKMYTNADRNTAGSFSDRWQEWFAGEWFAELKKLGSVPENGDACVGCMRMHQGEFEYWIGMLCPEGAIVPEGFIFSDIPAGDIGVVWIKGREDGTLYSLHEQSVAKIHEQGWKLADDTWFFERYNCPRFTVPDETGEIILDYVMYLKK